MIVVFGMWVLVVAVLGVAAVVGGVGVEGIRCCR